MVALPIEVREALQKKKMTFRDWAEKQGFNYNTAFAVATKRIEAKRKNTKSYQIKKALEELLREANKDVSTKNRRRTR